MQVYIGIDWSESKHDIVIMNESGAAIARQTIPHSPEGFLKLEAMCQSLEMTPADCLFGLETAHNLVIDFLWSRNYTNVYVIPPSVVKSTRGRYGQSRARTDQSDAFLLADLLRTDRLRLQPWHPDCILKEKGEKLAQMREAAYDAGVRPIDLFGDQETCEQHVPIIDALVNDNEGQFQVHVPNNGALAGLPDDVAVEVPAVVNRKGIQPLCVGSLPNKIMLERIYPVWLRVEQTLEALLNMEPNESMAYVGDINEHYDWPENW